MQYNDCCFQNTTLLLNYQVFHWSPESSPRSPVGPKHQDLQGMLGACWVVPDIIFRCFWMYCTKYMIVRNKVLFALNFCLSKAKADSHFYIAK